MKMNMITLKLNQVCIQTKDGYVCRSVPHSLNSKMHWTERNKWNMGWYEEVYYAMAQQRRKFGKLPYAQSRFLIRYYLTHPMDKDNAYGSAKPIIDGLRYAGVIVDDSIRHFDFEIEQIKIKKVTDQGVELICLNGIPAT